MRTLQENYALLGHLILDEKVYLDPTVSFTSICRAMGAPARELDALLEAELGMDGESVLRQLRAQEPAYLARKYGLKCFF